MHRIPHLGKLAALAAVAFLTPFLVAQDAAKKPAVIRIFVPANAVLEFEGAKTKATGEERTFITPPLDVGKNYVYSLKITYTLNGEQVVKEETARVTGGQETVLDLRPGATPPKTTSKRPRLDAPYVPTPQDVVDKMLELANVTDKDIVYDLGCGDGRIPVTAAKSYQAKGVGVDLDPVRIKESQDNVKRNKVEKLVEIREGNALKVADLGKATVVTLYLMPDLNAKLRPILEKELKPGTRVVMHDFDMDGWKPVKTEGVTDNEGNKHILYLYEIAAAAPKDAKKEAPPEKEPEPKKETAKRPKLDVPYLPTPQDVVEKMLDMAKVDKGDVVYDLGCGDARIPVTAARKYFATGVGIDIDPERIQDSIRNVKKNKVENKVEIREGDILKIKDLGKATVVTLYLLEEVNEQLLPLIKEQCKPGTRIVSHDFRIGNWKPLKEVTMKGSDGDDHDIYLWIVGKDLAEIGPEKIVAPDPVAKVEDREPDVIFVPTAQAVVDKMLELAEVKKGDVVYDLGCGDARIPVTAAKKYGVKAWGFDIDPDRIKDSTENVKKNKVENLVTIEKKDIFTLDLSKANVITLYLLPELNVKLIPQLEKLPKGSRIVSHDFDMQGVKPDKVIKMRATNDRGTEREHTIYLWTVPLKKEKKEDKEEEALLPQENSLPRGDTELTNLRDLIDTVPDQAPGFKRQPVPVRPAVKVVASADDKKEKRPDVIYVPTPQAVVDKMLEMAKVEKKDVVWDLGCGDGRIPVTAAKKLGCKARGFDVDPDRIKESLENVKKNKVENLVTIENKDIFTLDLSKEPTVVTLYLLPRLNVKLVPQLDKLPKGSRIVSHDFDMEGVKPDKVEKINAKDDEGNEREHTIYLWTIPLNKEKN